MRKFLVLCIAAALAGAITYGRQSGGASGQAAPVPISQEHHHHLIIENSYVKAYEVEVPAHESTLVHQHDYDYVYLVFGDASVTNAVVGKPEVKLFLPDTTLNFSKGPFAHVAGNAGDTPFRNVTISLLHPQGEAKSYYQTVSAALSPAMQQSPCQNNNKQGVNEVTLLQTDEVRVSAVSLDHAAIWPSAHDEPNRLVIFMDKMKDEKTPREKKAATFPAGLLKWFPAGQKSSIRNDTQFEMKFVVLEFKD